MTFPELLQEDNVLCYCLARAFLCVFLADLPCYCGIHPVAFYLFRGTPSFGWLLESGGVLSQGRSHCGVNGGRAVLSCPAL